MRVPLPWLAEYAALAPGTTGEQVAADLVRVGLEEEAVHGGDIVGPVVVGRVVEFSDEPQKKKSIRWCRVDVGGHNGPDGPRGIVCGAANFAPGDLVVVALPGAVLPGGFAISARKTYGHVSDGMICSARELGLGEDHDGIVRLAESGIDAEPGTDALELLGLAEQTVEIEVNPDRGYCLSIRGVAREYSHATGAAFTDPVPALRDEAPAPDPAGFAVELADAAPVRGTAGCDRVVTRIVTGVDPAAPSPSWLRRRLEQSGMRPISLTVDVTNYVMLALGQPLHAYDLSLLVPPLVVRRARTGERLTTLDGADRALHPEDLLISDSSGGHGSRALGLAGVMGGAQTEVSAGTSDVLIEAAHFDQVSIARTARRHKLTSEASRRFERGVDHDLPVAAAELAVRLLVAHGGGTPGPLTDADDRPGSQPIVMDAGLPGRLVGLDIPADEVVGTLRMIGCAVSGPEGGPGERFLTVSAPTWRPDLRLPVDLVEEVARLHGYEDIPSALPSPPPGRGLTPAQLARRSVARALAEHGLVEVQTYPFVSPDVHDAMRVPAADPRRTATHLLNPISDERPQLRTSLLATLVDAVRLNEGRGNPDLALFEIGRVVRPVPGAPAAPVPAVARRPADEELAAVLAAVPPQPHRVAVVLTGWREAPGWQGPGRRAQWSDAVEAALVAARALGVEPVVAQDEHEPWHPGRCARISVGDTLLGHAGELDPRVLEALGLPERSVAAELDLDALVRIAPPVVEALAVPTFPVAKEDVAVVVPDSTPVAAVAAALAAGAGDLLESVRLFDVFTGPQVGDGRRSLAFTLRMRAADRTLTADELAAVRTAALERAAAETGAVLRGSTG